MSANPSESFPMTEAQYLAFETSSAEKHEYSQGRIVAMSGGSTDHNLITMNTGIQLGIHLDGSDCKILSSDTKIHIAARNAYRYPDLTVVCGDLLHVPGRDDTIINPILLVEVLSPSTAPIDRGDKLQEYTQIESLQEYLLIAQDEASIQHFTRQDNIQWTYTHITGLESEIHLPSLDCTLSLSKIYRQVSWMG